MKLDEILFEALPPQHTGYIYLWFDSKRKMFYIGSHFGQVTDDYLCSNKRCKRAIKRRPDTFRFRVLEYCNVDEKSVRSIEEKWLQMINIEELGVKYYNLKRFATGGNIYGELSEEKKLQHRTKTGKASKQRWIDMSIEEYTRRQKTAFGGNTFDRNYIKTQEYRDNMRLATLGEKNGFYGKTHSKETLDKLKERSSGNEYRADTYRFSRGDESFTITNMAKYMRENNIANIKYMRFLGTNKPITSFRQPNHPWVGFTVEKLS